MLALVESAEDGKSFEESSFGASASGSDEAYGLASASASSSDDD